MSTQFVKTFLFQAIRFSQTILIQSIQFSINIVYVQKQLNVKTVLFQVIQFCISTQFRSICPIDRTLSGATSPGRVDLGAMAMKSASHSPKLQHYLNLPIRLFSVISRTIVVGGSYPSAEVRSVYSTAPADWAKNT